MSYIDVSVSVSEKLPVWPGSPNIQFEKSLSLSDGDVADDTTLHFSVHTGTHIDAPSHFLEGKKSVDEISLDVLIGSTYLVEFPSSIDLIDGKLLDSLDLPANIERLLFKTRNSLLWNADQHSFDKEFVALTMDAAQWVVDKGIRLVGIDYFSIQRFYDGPETHRILLGAEVVVIEGLDLTQVETGYYELLCLPLKLKGIEGAPARVILKPIEILSD